LFPLMSFSCFCPFSPATFFRPHSPKTALELVCAYVTGASGCALAWAHPLSFPCVVDLREDDTYGPALVNLLMNTSTLPPLRFYSSPRHFLFHLEPGEIPLKCLPPVTPAPIFLPLHMDRTSGAVCVETLARAAFTTPVFFFLSPHVLIVQA